MSITRTEAELQSAIETMFRVRAVESPPDEQGARTIWHRGSRGADLVTWVDAFGRVTRQELYLFEDCLIWEKGVGVRTGAAEPAEGSKVNPSPDSISFDPGNDEDRLVRARRALTPYSGGDKFIIHARQLVGGGSLDDNEITRSAEKVNEEALRAAAERHTRGTDKVAALQRGRRALWVWVALAALACGAAAAWFLSRGP